MKFFSNFDTERKQEAYTEAVQKFSAENVLVLKKSGLFLLVKVIFPLLRWTLVFGALQFPIYISLEEFGNVRYILTAIMLLVYGVMVSPVFKYYIDYLMDFSLVTPQYFTRYNQSGVLKRDIIASNVSNIKTITIEKNSLLYNIFDNGDLIVLSEGDRDDDGEIVLHYIKNPEAKKREMTRIMNTVLA